MRSWTDVKVEELATGEGMLSVITLERGKPRSRSASGRSIRIAIGSADRLIRTVTTASSLFPLPARGRLRCCDLPPRFDARALEIKSYIIKGADDTSSLYGSGPYDVSEPDAPSGFGPADPVAASLPDRQVSGNAAMSASTRFKWLATDSGGRLGHSEFDVNGGTAAFIGPANCPRGRRNRRYRSLKRSAAGAGR